MGYEVALEKAWEGLSRLELPGIFLIRFLGDEYSIESSRRLILSGACNIPAKDFVAILILHYAAQKMRGLPQVSGEWLTFREFSGIEGYYQAFRERSLKPLIRKYGANPSGLREAGRRFPVEPVKAADAGIVVTAFEGVPVLVKVWGGDEDFGPDANMYFDRSITRIFCTEDIVVLAGMVAAAL